MALEKIFAILNQKIGLNPGSVGESSIERAVHHRISFRNCINTKEYFELLKYDTKEVLALIEEVVVPETWFFRNKIPFQAFTQHVINALLPKCNKRKPIRILSIPCASGEEPYSLAIALVDANINPQSFRIDAVDVSKKAIESAKKAHYGKNSFRDVELALRDKYFEKTEKGWQLHDSIRKLVKFKQGNILTEELSPHPAYYDVIFCRNLLIYFDRETQQQTLARLYRALKKGAILFVGHAECSQVSNIFFQHAPYSKSFSFIKREKPVENSPRLKEKKSSAGLKILQGGAKSSAVPGVHNKTVKDTDDINRPVTAALLKTMTVKSTSAGSVPLHKSGESRKTSANKSFIQSLRPVEKLVNESRYESAEEKCVAYLEIHPESAHGHYLLGLIKQVRGDQKAAESLLKKAIYLDPNHEQALVLSCSIAELKGDTELVQSFKRRIDRVKNRKPSEKS